MGQLIDIIQGHPDLFWQCNKEIASTCTTGYRLVLATENTIWCRNPKNMLNGLGPRHMYMRVPARYQMSVFEFVIVDEELSITDMCNFTSTYRAARDTPLGNILAHVGRSGLPNEYLYDVLFEFNEHVHVEALRTVTFALLEYLADHGITIAPLVRNYNRKTLCLNLILYRLPIPDDMAFTWLFGQLIYHDGAEYNFRCNEDAYRCIMQSYKKWHPDGHYKFITSQHTFYYKYFKESVEPCISTFIYWTVRYALEEAA